MSVAASAAAIHASVSRVVIHVQARSSAAAARSPSTCRGSIGSSVTIRPASVGLSCSWLQSMPYVYTAAAYADLRIRLHDVRVALRGARPKRRDAEVPRLLEREGAEAVLGLRHARRPVDAQLRADGGRRRVLRRLLRLRPLEIRFASRYQSRA